MIYIEALKNVFRITKGKRGLILWWIFCSVAFNFALLLPPIAAAKIVDVLATGGSLEDLIFWAVMFAVFYVAHYLPRLLCWDAYAKVAKYYHLHIQKKLLEHLTNNDAIFEDIPKGRILATCTDDIRWVVDVVDCAEIAIARVLKLAMIFIIFAANNIFVAMVAVLVDILYLALMDRDSKKFARHYDSSRKYEDKAADIFTQVTRNPKQIRAMNLAPALIKKYDRVGQKWGDEYLKRRHFRARVFVTDPWVVYIGKAMLYLIMGYFVLNGEMALATLVLLISYFEQMVTCTDEIRDSLIAIAEYNVRTKRVLKLLSYTQKSEVEFGDLDNDYIAGLVEFQNVSFKKDGRAILKRVSFKARPNEITVVIGPRGAGKTSIVNLLHRLNRVTSGQILIDGENIYNYSKKVYNSNVSGVFQKPFVLDVSIRENLSLVEKNHKKQEEICKRIGLDTEIKKLPQGYDTVVTDDESVLTEGDKQLLAVARAILTKAEILIFDEVSSVGAQAIPNLSEILEDLKQDHTVILITHEKDLIRKADRVVELNDGKVMRTLKKKRAEEKLEKKL